MNDMNKMIDATASMDRKTRVKNLVAALNAALKEFGEKNGVVVKNGAARYTQTDFRTQIEIIEAAGGSTADHERAEFERYCGAFGFEKGDYGREFKMFTGAFVLCGFKARARTKAVLAKEVGTDKLFRFDERFVMAQLHPTTAGA